MPRQKTDRYETWYLDRDDRTWTLAKGASIGVGVSSNGLVDVADGSTIRIFGNVMAYSTAVILGSQSASLLVGERARISAAGTGIGNEVDGGGIVKNHGQVFGGSYGVFAQDIEIRNTGSIAGDVAISVLGEANSIRNEGRISGSGYGIEAYGHDTITNTAGARISGGDRGLDLNGDAQVYRLHNAGTIVGGDEAIVCDGSLTMTNRGTIIGDIVLGDGGNQIDTRGGTVRGTIIGGNDADLYLISSSDIRIVDMGSSFSDTVNSSVSYVLTGGLDHLMLIGRKNIDGTGNDAVNTLIGNGGNNRLNAGIGDDFLVGSGGSDWLAGGEGADTFEFYDDFDTDRITDFTDGIDRLYSGDVQTEKEFNRLDIRQSGNNVVIDFGRGDRVIIEDITAGAISLADFFT
jgi:Ca2+-binding RTX toxin-like protein